MQYNTKNMKRFLLMSIFTAIMALMGCKANSTEKATFNSVDVPEFEKAIADTGVVVLDVRTAEEYADGHLAGAINIDVLNDDFEKNVKQSIPTGKKVALYCRSGRRSKKAASIMAADGYSVTELATGYLGWTNASKPTTK